MTIFLGIAKTHRRELGGRFCGNCQSRSHSQMAFQSYIHFTARLVWMATEHCQRSLAGAFPGSSGCDAASSDRLW